MSLEEQIAKLNANVETLNGAMIALAAHISASAGGTTVINNGSTAATPSPAPAADKTKKKTGTRPNPATVDADPFADAGGSGEDDPFASGGEEAVTLDDVKKKFLATRDLAMAKFGEEEGRTKTRELLNKFAEKLDSITPEQFDDAMAACDKAQAGMAKMKDKK